MAPHQLSRSDARRVAIRAQRLDAERPASLRELVDDLTLLQLDPTAAIAPSADLVSWSRLGSAYDRSELVQAVADHDVIELLAFLRPAGDLALYRPEMAAGPDAERARDWYPAHYAWVESNDACRRDILSRLSREGPLVSRELPDTCAVPWESTGWTHNRNVVQLLVNLVRTGEVAVAGRSGKERLWDLAERVYPDDSLPDLIEARQLRDERRLSGLGIARARGAATQGESTQVGSAGERAEIEGVPGQWRIDPTLLDQPFTGRAALLSPFDRLLHDRRRTADLFDFEYLLEMYKPAAVRRWGYFALPILFGDELVGKLDAKADHKAGLLRVHALHWDTETTPALVDSVQAEIDDLAAWLGLEVEAGI